MRIICIGLGLIGGSLMKALQGRASRIGVDSDAETRRASLRTGAVEEVYATWQDAPLEAADLVVLCLHPQGCLDTLRDIAPQLKPGTVVTDVCGIKQPICSLAMEVLPEGVSFVGGHPMAGREKGGFAHADAKLFKDAHYLLCPLPGTPPEALQRVRDMIMPLGCADIIETTPENHDTQVAYTSQMMHVLALAICEQDSLAPSHGFEGGSFRGTTRVATMDVALWMQLLWPNKNALSAQISQLIDKLSGYRALLDGEDAGALQKRMEAAVRRKEAYREAGTGESRRGHLPDFD